MFCATYVSLLDVVWYDLLFFVVEFIMIGGYEDNLVGPILCFTLRGQSDIREIPDPNNVFKALFFGRVRVHGKKAGSDPIPGGMRTLVHNTTQHYTTLHNTTLLSTTQY